MVVECIVENSDRIVKKLTVKGMKRIRMLMMNVGKRETCLAMTGMVRASDTAWMKSQ